MQVEKTSDNTGNQDSAGMVLRIFRIIDGSVWKPKDFVEKLDGAADGEFQSLK